MEKMLTWGTPNGQLFLINSKAELVKLINKMGLAGDEEFYDLAGIETVTRQMNDDELDEYGLKYDPEYPSDTEIQNTIYTDDNVIELPIFDKNPYFTMEEQNSHYSDPCYLIENEDDIKLADYYKFPVVIYAYIDDAWDRAGPLSIRLWNIEPLEDLMTINKLQQEEDDFKDRWIQNMNDRIEMEETRYANTKRT